jgi:poly-gamma-glutamate synthesis protein (capsule biosynthesis protein)
MSNHRSQDISAVKTSSKVFIVILTFVFIAAVAVAAYILIVVQPFKEEPKPLAFYGPEYTVDQDLSITTVVKSGDTFDTTKPLYIVFHGYSSNESDSGEDLVKKLTGDPEAQFAILRAPIDLNSLSAANTGYAWYLPAVPDNPSVGPKQASDAVLRWIHEHVSEGQEIVPIGFSQGALMVTEIMRSEPSLFTAGVAFSGQVVQDDVAGDKQLAALSPSSRPKLYMAITTEDDVIPEPFFESGLPKVQSLFNVTTKNYKANHTINSDEISDVNKFLQTINSAKQGKGPKCPDNYCFTMSFNGDLLFHPGLWNKFKSPSGLDGEFDFTELFEELTPYFNESDINICNFETPIAPEGGPYVGYPVFNIPPVVADYAAKAGYNTCTHATNHSFDRGTAGIERMWDRLAKLGINQVGSYKDEETSKHPLLVSTPGGTLGLVSGSVSLNAQTPDFDWQVDRMRDDAASRAKDVANAERKADEARANGANVVVLVLHSVQEYIDYADSWQLSSAHELADSGKFDFIYFHGSHSVQPVELYQNATGKQTWIIYGVGNAVTESADTAATLVNNQGVTYRVQFAGPSLKTSADATSNAWRPVDISFMPSSNTKDGKYKWCPLANPTVQSYCLPQPKNDIAVNRILGVIESMGVKVNSSILHEWVLKANQ